MGKSTRWFLSLIGLKKSAKSSSSSADQRKSSPDEAARKSKEKRRWSFGKSSDLPKLSGDTRDYQSDHQHQAKHAMAIAAASAAAAEAAVAAAQAAAVVVRLTGGGNYGHPVFELISREEWAAIRIQTAFRGYLARRALRALKAVVRIQALFRGHRVRKQAAITLRCMQALVRVQARVRARRVRMSEEGQAVQQQLWERRQLQQGRSRKSVDGWNATTGTVQEFVAKNQRKQLGAMKRERALAYALSQFQSQQGTAPQMVIDCEPDTPHWGWSWLERWMAARPWENPFEAAATSPLSGCTKIVEVDPAQQQQQQQSSNNVKNSNIHHQQQQQRSKPLKKRSGSASDSISSNPAAPAQDHHTTTPQSSSAYQLVSPTSTMTREAPSFDHHPPAFDHHRHPPTAAAAAVLSHPSPAAAIDDHHSDRMTSAEEVEDNVWAAMNNLGLKPLRSNGIEDELDHLQQQQKDEDLLASFPNYMATTQSSKAKVRSQSTPKQRPENVTPDTPRKRNSLAGNLESRSVSSGGILLRSSQRNQQRGFSGSVILDRSLISLKDGQSTLSVNGDLRFKPKFRF